MPNSRLDRARGTLPEGYQFGDAGAYGTPNDALTRWQPQSTPLTKTYDQKFSIGAPISFTFPSWRRSSENAAERLASAAFRITQAQIAADLHAGEQ